MDFFKKRKQAKQDAQDAKRRVDLSERKGIWSPSLDDRRRLAVQDILMQGEQIGAEDGMFTITAGMFAAAIMRHAAIPEDAGVDEESSKYAERDAAALSQLTSAYLQKYHMGGGR